MFAGRPPVNPEARADATVVAKSWRGAQGLADDVRYYGKWMRDQAEKAHWPPVPEGRGHQRDGAGPPRPPTVRRPRTDRDRVAVGADS